MSPVVVDASTANGLPHIHAYCEHCSRHDLDKKEYKRCGGCSAVLYCSKECQRAAWPTHKAACRWKVPSVSELGYATPLALKKMLQEWTNTHYYALTTIANAAVYLNGGWEVVRSQPYAIVMRLQATPYSKDANPSQAFRVMKTLIAHRDSHSALRDSWAGVMEDCWVVEQGVRQNRADTIAANLLGVVPAMILLEGAEDIVLIHKWMIFRHDVRHVPDSPTDETTIRAFKDLVYLCAGVIRGGYVFRAPQDRAEREPEFGWLVKTKNQKWKWEKLDVDVNVIVTTTENTTPSGLTNRQLLTLFRPL